MKSWCAEQKRISKLCYKCVNKCKHKSIGELTFCWRMKPKVEDI